MEFRCQKRSSLDEKNVESSDISRNESTVSHSGDSSVFSELSCFVAKNASLARAVHSALVRNETRSWSIAQR
jgi:hypothetical protein